jgi:RNA polymerase sigma-70 factor (ECF subfamily)
LSKYSDHQIWDKFKSGDRLAFTYIYNKHINALYNFGNQFTIDKELVKDCIHDLFVELRKPGKSSKILSIKSYLYKSLYRILIKKINKEAQLVSDENIDPSFQITLSPEHILIDQQLTKDMRANIEHSLNKLSVKQRQAILLYFYDELTYKEISEVFGMNNVKSARKLIYRALDKLKLHIQPFFF